VIRPGRNAQTHVTPGADSEAAWKLAIEQIDRTLEIPQPGWMISKILGDDVERTPAGTAKLEKGWLLTASSSLVDTGGMRHGRKSASKS